MMRMIDGARGSAFAFVITLLLPVSAGAAFAQATEAPGSDRSDNGATNSAGGGTDSGDSAAASGDASGQTAFNNHCRTCHSTDAGDNRLGPSLAGIVGRKAGSVEGFAYSQSLKSSGVTFDEATLDTFIADPASVAPGNNMKPYSGIADTKVRAEIVGFLKTK